MGVDRKCVLLIFYRAGQWCDQGGQLTDFVDQEKAKGRILYGYGRPLAKTDERISYTLEKAGSWDWLEVAICKWPRKSIGILKRNTGMR